MAEDEGGTLGIGAVARRTGLSPDVIRVWERRHHAVEPNRSEGGTRLYSERNVRRLETLARLVGRGHRIGQLAQLEDDELSELLRGPSGENPSEGIASDLPEPAPVLDTVIRDAIEATLALDPSRLETTLSHPFFVLGPRGFILQVAVPLLQRIGDLWEAGELSVASEHAAVGVLRTLLGGALRGRRPRDGAPRFVFATPTGQRHEFGALAAAVLASEQGVDALYLGSDLPADDLAAAILDSGATTAVLGIASSNEEDARRFIEAVRRNLSTGVTLCVGGGACDSIARQTGVVGFSTLEGFEASLLPEGRGRADAALAMERPVAER